MTAPQPAAPFDSVELAAAPSPRRRRFWWLLAAWTVYGVLFASLYNVLPTTMVREVREFWLLPFLRSLIPAWIWAAWTPLIVRATRRLDARTAARAVQRAVSGAPRSSRLRAWARAVVVHLPLALGICVLTSLARWLVNLALDGEWTLPYIFAYWLDYNLFTYAVVAGITHALDLHGRWLARARRELALQAELAGAKLQFLRRQLQPHFLFNTLNATAELTREDPPRAGRMLRHLQRLLRSALARSDTEELALRDELATLEPYVELQRMRFDDQLRVVRQVDPAVLDARVPVFVLQPLVENAVQHGLSACRGGGTLEIAAAADGDRLRLEVRDDGPGPRPGGFERRGGIGLRNTRARLAQLYGSEGTLELVPRPTGGTAAVITIPLRLLSWPSGAYATPITEAAPSSVGRATPGAIPMAARLALPAVPEPPDEDAALPAMNLTGEMPISALLPPPPPPYQVWMLSFLAWSAVGAMWVLQGVLRQVTARHEGLDLYATTIDLWNALAWALLTPLVLLLARRCRVRRSTWARAAVVHVTLALGISIVHLWAVVSIGQRLGLTELPVLHILHLQQFTLNLVIYAGLVTWSHAREFSTWHRTRVLSQARLDTALAQARWQALALELRPEFLLAVLERIAGLAPVDPPRAERLVERLADFMRSLLDTVGRPQQPLRDELALLNECLALWAEATAREVSLAVEVPAPTLDRQVSSGAFRTLTNAVVAQEPHAGERVSLHIGTAPRGGRMALTLRSSVPIRPDTIGQPAPYDMVGADFPDVRTAVLDLGPIEGPEGSGARASSPVITARAS